MRKSIHLSKKKLLNTRLEKLDPFLILRTNKCYSNKLFEITWKYYKELLVCDKNILFKI